MGKVSYFPKAWFDGADTSAEKLMVGVGKRSKQGLFIIKAPN
jgi:hypothetical protein